VAVATARTRIVFLLLAAFAAAALLLAAVGLYGLVSYSVVRRNREMGLRLALGAARVQLLAIAMQPAVLLALAGAVAGLGASLVLTRFLQALLFSVQPSDPGPLLAAAILLTGVAAVAALLPALRATRIDPARALNSD
jgi:putative ABC transport system permease protein